MKKTLIGLGTIFSVATPIALVVACSNPGTQNKSRIAFIPDNSKIRGNQFLESTEAGVLAVDKNAQIITSETQVLIGNAYNTAVENGANILVTTGFGHEAHIKEYASTHTSIKFIYVDGQIQAKNISSIYFNMKEISFIAGYRMAASNQVQNNKHSIGVYGAVNIPNVTEYIKGVKAGVDYFNNHKPSGIQNDVTLEDGGFVGDFNVGGKSRTIAKSLVSKNDIVLSVGGGQWHDVMEEIKAETTHDTKLIGVDIDVAKTLKDQTEKGYVWGSILKGLKHSTQTVLEDITKNRNSTFLNNIYISNIDNKGTGLVIGDKEITFSKEVDVIEAKRLYI